MSTKILSLALILVIFVVITAFICFVVSQIKKRNERKAKAKAFKTIFGINPTCAKERTPGEQMVIFRVLKVKAQEFHIFIKGKEKTFSKIKNMREEGVLEEGIADVLSREDNAWMYVQGLEKNIDGFIEHLETGVRLKKQDFWYAHNLAKLFDYKVKKRYSDYLPC